MAERVRTGIQIIVRARRTDEDLRSSVMWSWVVLDPGHS